MSSIVPSHPSLPEPSLPPARPPARHPAPVVDGLPAGEGLALPEYLAALRRYLWLVVLAAVISVGYAAYQMSQELPRYTAYSSVRLVNVRQEMAGEMTPGQGADLPGWYTDPILSQIQVLRSRAVASEVVDSLGLRLRPAQANFPWGFVRTARVSAAAPVGDTVHLGFASDRVTGRLGQRRAVAAYGQPLDLGTVALTFERRPQGVVDGRMFIQDEQSAVMQVIGSLHGAQRQLTNFIDIQYTANDPVLSQRAANAAAAAFQSQNMRSAQTLARRRRQFIEEQLRTMDSLLVRAQFQLSDFRKGVGAFSPREKFHSTEAGMADLRIQRQRLTQEKSTYDRLFSALRSGQREASEQVAALAASPEVANNPGVVGLYQQLIRYQTARDSMTTGQWARAATNPDVQQLDSLVATYRGRLVSAVQARSDALTANISVLDQVMSSDIASIQRLPDAEAQETRLSREVETLQRLVDDLRRNQQEARIEEAVEAGQVEVVDWAMTPGGPVAQRANRRLLFALLIGLVLGGGGALLLDRLNTSLVRREDAEAALQTPVIAVIPRLGEPLRPAERLRLPGMAGRLLPTRKRPPTETLVTASDLHSAGSQAYRKLRTHLLFSRQGAPLRTLMVTSPAAGEGKTTVAGNLATTFAQQSLRVLLVDADLRRARAHGLMGVSRTPGLTEVLQGEVTLDESLQATVVENLQVLAAGRLVPHVSELLGGAAMGRLLREVQTRFDLVVLDTPPVLAAADAEILGAQADAVVMVVRAGQTERQNAQYAVQQLRAIGARIVGAVLNDPDQKISGDRRYAYYYDYYQDPEGV